MINCDKTPKIDAPKNGKVEYLLNELGNNGPFFELRDQLQEIIYRLTGPEPKPKEDKNTKESPIGIIEQAHYRYEERQILISDLYNTVRHLNDLV
jgi:hypothetical protein